mgnify:FL=1
MFIYAYKKPINSYRYKVFSSWNHPLLRLWWKTYILPSSLEKTISTLDGEFKIVNMGYRCENPSCSNTTVYRSAQAEHLSMKHITYGMDVIAYIGHLRFKEHKARTEMASILKEKKVKISDRQVQKLYERYALLLRANVKETVKDDLQKVVNEHGGIILFIDGVQPEKGNETLYVIREVLSGTILAAHNLKSRASQELMDFIRPVLAV